MLSVTQLEDRAFNEMMMKGEDGEDSSSTRALQRKAPAKKKRGRRRRVVRKLMKLLGLRGKDKQAHTTLQSPS